MRNESSAESGDNSHFTFTASDMGCWVDGAFGMDHAIRKLRDLVTRIDKSHKLLEEYHAEIVGNSLKQWITDGYAGEWLDDATEVLQDHTSPGLVWIWEAGDLILMDESEVGR